MTIDIRELHLLAFGERVAGWYDEACRVWREAYGQAGDPPVLLLSRGGFSGYGKSLADAGPTPVDGRIIRYLIRLFANARTQSYISDPQLRADLIAHELGHVFEAAVLGVAFGAKKKKCDSTHGTTTWRTACTVATPCLLPELVAEADTLGVSLASVFALRPSRVQRCNVSVTRVPIPGALSVDRMAQWPEGFRSPEGRAAFTAACHAVAAQQQRNVEELTAATS